MYTYQDLLGTDNVMKFIRNAIVKHEQSDEFQIACDAQQYYKHQNVTIVNYKKLIYTVTGKLVPDKFNANYKLASKFFYRFVTQENQYLLSNGVTWDKSETGDKLGNKQYDFDHQLQEAGRNALIEGVSFGFWNLDHLEVFKFTEFVPLYDEITGALRAGIRYWQIDTTKPLRATLYEEDGYTEYIWGDRTLSDGKGKILNEKTKYILHIQSSEADGIQITDGENYPSFPIVPLWGNPAHQSELIGLREQIDCYDLIKSGFANTVDEASIIYWTLQNAGGMDDMDLAEFVKRMQTIHAVNLDDGVQAEGHSLDAPFESREALLTRLRGDMYEDAMALDTKNIANGAVTATQIDAAYEPLDSKANEYEYQILQFVQGILNLAGIEDTATFTRSKIVNMQENITAIMTCAQYLESGYVTKKLLTMFGDGDLAEEMTAAMDEAELQQFGSVQDDNTGAFSG